MSVTLEEALREVELEVGRTYYCQVRGHWVELRVLGPDAPEFVSSFSESDVMLDPWVEFPPPEPRGQHLSHLGELPPPDVPEIPGDGEGP